MSNRLFESIKELTVKTQFKGAIRPCAGVVGVVCCGQEYAMLLGIRNFVNNVDTRMANEYVGV